MLFLTTTKRVLLGGLLAASTLAHPSIAQNASPDELPTSWTLPACVEYARSNNLQVQFDQLSARTAAAQAKQARFNMLPTLNGQASHNYQFGRNADPTTNTFINQQIRTNNFGAQARLPLFQGFRNWNNIEAREADQAASEADAQTTENTVLLNVTNAFLQILLGRELLAQAEAQAENVGAQVDQTRRLVEAGAAPEADLLELQSQLASSQVDIINAENQLMLARVNLQQLLQLPVRDDFQVDAPADLTVPALVALEPAATVYTTALQTQPQIEAADLRVKSGVLGIKTARAGLYPTLDFTAGLFTTFSSARVRRIQTGNEPTDLIFLQTTEGPLPVPASLFESGTQSADFESVPFFTQLGDNFSQSVGLTLTVPILNGWQTRTTVETATVQAKQAQTQAQIVRNNLRQEIEQAHADAVAAAKRYEATQAQVTALQEAFRATEQRFDVGASNATEYDIARQNLLRAESALAEAKYNYVFTTKVLDFYLGKPLTLD